MIVLWRLYRPFMRLAHYFNWHHMAVIGPLEDGRTQAWCQWCGVRDYIIDMDAIREELSHE